MAGRCGRRSRCGNPALEVPLDGAVRALARRGFVAASLAVIRPAGRGPLELSAVDESGAVGIVELYGPNQRSGGALLQFWRWLRLRNNETAPLQTSMRRAVEHRALMTIAADDLGVANTKTMAVATLDRGWTLYAHSLPEGVTVDQTQDQDTVDSIWRALGILNVNQISHGDLRLEQITVSSGNAMFGGFGGSEYGATDEQLQSDIAQLLITTANRFGAEPSVRAAIEVLGKSGSQCVWPPHSVGDPARIRKSVTDAKAIATATRDEVKKQTGADQIQAETITRFTRNQVIQLVLLVALVYVATPLISTVPAFLDELRNANWWWALLGLTVSALTYVGAAAALWASAAGW